MKSPMTAARAHASLAGLGLVLLMSACAPSTPDVDAWRTNAQHALSDGASAVHAAEVALRLRTRDRIYAPYLPTVLVDAEEAIGVAGDTIGTQQPPRAERAWYDAVTGELEKASSLVATARIAVVDGETRRYAALTDRLADAASALQGLEEDLKQAVDPPSRAAAVEAAR